MLFMKDNRVIEWLENPDADFEEGVKLYKEFASQKTYSEYFEKSSGAKPFSMAWNLLKAELIKIAPTLPTSVGTKVPTSFPFNSIKKQLNDIDKAANKENPFFNPNGLNEEGKAKFRRIKDIGKELASKKAMLDKATTNEERQVLAQALCDLEDERFELWDIIDSLQVNEIKEEIGNSQDDAFKAVHLYKRILILRNNIARNEKEAEKVNGTRQEKLLSKAEEFKKELQISVNEFKTITGRDWDDRTE